MPDTPVWEEVRRIYDDHTIPIPAVCARFGISAYDLSRARLAGGWAPRPNVAQRQANRRAALHPAATAVSAPDPLPSDLAEPAVPQSDPAPPEAPPPVTAKASRAKRAAPLGERRLLVARLTAAIETKLALLERRFAREMEASATKDKATSAADTERDTRTIGLIIKNLEQVSEYGHAHQPGPHLRGAAAKSAALAASQLADEADRLRRELGERLSRFIDAAAAAPDGVSPEPQT